MRPRHRLRVGILGKSREPVVVLVGMIAVTGDVAACVGVMVSVSLLQPRSSVSEKVDVARQGVRTAAVAAATSV
jgi:hypothetical protein